VRGCAWPAGPMPPLLRGSDDGQMRNSPVRRQSPVIGVGECAGWMAGGGDVYRGTVLNFTYEIHYVDP